MKKFSLSIIILALLSAGCSVYNDKEAASRDLKNTYQGVRSINGSIERLRSQITKQNKQFDKASRERLKGTAESEKSLAKIKKDLLTLKVTQANSLKETNAVADTLQKMISNLEEYNYRVTAVTKRIESIDSRVSQLGDIYQKIAENEELRIGLEKTVASDHEARWNDLGKLSISLQTDLAELRVLIDSLGSAANVKSVQTGSKKKITKKIKPTTKIAFPVAKQVDKPTTVAGQQDSNPRLQGNAPPPLVSSAPDELFKVAYKDYLSGNYKLAISGFQSFLDAYPVSERASNARYWIGECHYAEGEYKKAIDSFAKILKLHPTSIKASSALLKIAYSNLNLKQTQEAIIHMNKLITDYPNSGDAELAKDKLKLLGALEKKPG